MTFSTSVGMKTAWLGIGATWLTHWFAQIPSDPTMPPPLSPAVASAMTWPAAVVSLGGLVITAISLYQKITENKRGVEQVKAELAQSQKDHARAVRAHKKTRRELQKTQKGLTVTRKNRHDERSDLAEIFSEIRDKQATIAEGINTNSVAIRKLLDEAGHKDLPTATPINPWLPDAKIGPVAIRSSSDVIPQTVFSDPPRDATGKRIYTSPKEAKP